MIGCYTCSDVLFNLTMPIFCSGNLLRSKQRKSFDAVKEEQSLMIKRKSSALFSDLGVSIVKFFDLFCD